MNVDSVLHPAENAELLGCCLSNARPAAVLIENRKLPPSALWFLDPVDRRRSRDQLVLPVVLLLFAFRPVVDQRSRVECFFHVFYFLFIKKLLIPSFHLLPFGRDSQYFRASAT